MAPGGGGSRAPGPGHAPRLVALDPVDPRQTLDPVAHTLVGASLAETGLRRWSPLATGTLIAGVNLPDIDGIAGFWGRDTSLLLRRGHTHGVLAMVVLPLVLTGVVLAFDRFIRRRRDPDAAPARAGPILALAYLGTLSHPALDWMNTYGVRLLMPFDGTWFYGDSLFIVDPWMWLLAAAAVVLARSQRKLSVAAWVVLGCATSALVTVTSYVPLPAKVVWFTGVAAIVAARWRGAKPPTVRRVAAVCIGLLLVYISGMVIGSRTARAQAQDWFVAQGQTPTAIMAAPRPTNPFAHDIIAAVGDEYRFARVDWLKDPPVWSTVAPMSGDIRTPIVQAALAAPSVRGMVNWMRFPSYVVEQDGDGWRVIILDARYSSRGAGIGRAEVRLDAALRPR